MLLLEYFLLLVFGFINCNLKNGEEEIIWREIDIVCWEYRMGYLVGSYLSISVYKGDL